MKTYTLHRFGLFALLKFGFATGIVAALPVVSFFIISIWRTAINLLDWLANYEIVIPIRLVLINDELVLNALELLRGWRPIDYLESIAGMRWIQIILFILLITFLIGIWTALVAFFSGMAFNLLAWMTGGLKLSVTGGDLQPASQQPYVVSAAYSQPQPAGPRLEITAPIRSLFPITSQVTLIGSGPDCALRLDGLQPRHAQLFYEDGRYILRDFSQGDSMVQGRVMDGLNMLKDGFQIQLGPYSMMFRY